MIGVDIGVGMDNTSRSPSWYLGHRKIAGPERVERFHNSGMSIMVLIFDHTEHVAQVWRKKVFSEKKYPICDLPNVLNRSNHRDNSLRAHLFMSYHLIHVPWVSREYLSQALQVLGDAIIATKKSAQLYLWFTFDFWQLLSLCICPFSLSAYTYVKCKSILELCSFSIVLIIVKIFILTLMILG